MVGVCLDSELSLLSKHFLRRTAVCSQGIKEHYGWQSVIGSCDDGVVEIISISTQVQHTKENL